MAKCPNCGAELAEGQLFCGECGAKAPKKSIEWKCGCINQNMLINHEKFCPSCGQKTQYGILNDAENGDIDAMLYMGVLLRMWYGKVASASENDPDVKKAYELLTKAADKGSNRALGFLGYFKFLDYFNFDTKTVNDACQSSFNILVDAYKKGGFMETFLVAAAYDLVDQREDSFEEVKEALNCDDIRDNPISKNIQRTYSVIQRTIDHFYDNELPFHAYSQVYQLFFTYYCGKFNDTIYM